MAEAVLGAPGDRGHVPSVQEATAGQGVPLGGQPHSGPRKPAQRVPTTNNGTRPEEKQTMPL